MRNRQDKNRKKTEEELRKQLRILIGLIAALSVLLIVLVTGSVRRGRQSRTEAASENSLVSAGSVNTADSSDSAETSDSSGSYTESSVSADSSNAQDSSASGVRKALPIDEQEMVTTDTSVDWRLVLVNPTHKLPDDFEVDTSMIAYTDDEDRRFDSRAVDALDEMLSDCEAAGYDPVLRASYRSQSTQEYLFDRKIGQLLDDGYSQSGAEAKAATIVAVPGTSEHQLGLAADIASQSDHSLTAAEADTPVQQWLMEHCVDYGFILRFPDGKSDYTGIIYEPWHYRYVGKEYAKEITDSGMCLEEYLASKGIGN